MESSVLLAGLVTLLLMLVALRTLGRGGAYDTGAHTSSSKATGPGSLNDRPVGKGRTKPIGAEYSAAEVREHCDENDLWLVIDGKVYDFTPYVIQHPGGDAILRNAGADSTEGFHGPQHGENVKRMIADYYIGELKSQTLTLTPGGRKHADVCGWKLAYKKLRKCSSTALDLARGERSNAKPLLISLRQNGIVPG
ncbi:Cytochrome B5-like protein [Porphyridium purpureum]|uniref:Cytochrome B5-like protein n=1 Tax=Porphyridium purpureum TaxID=35688 RepID=A0A5J4Z5R1_PORPP|nr:Cytochrome B5-like protein [Porphyridium purpureum]|eukprot:POR1189..scf295_1